MASHDISNDPRTDAELPAIPPTIVAETGRDGLVTIYDEKHETAWISSTQALVVRLVR